MRVLSLFSGGGLGDYGLELAGMEVIGQVEIDDYCQKILKLRWPEVPKWGDIREFSGHQFVEANGMVDIISGGFPCQDISTAGKGAGITGKRSGLWKEMFRIICEIRPRYVLVENVTALLGRGFGTVLGDLAQSGYDTEWDCIPASAVGAPHQRDRIWIVAYTTGQRSMRGSGEIQQEDGGQGAALLRKSIGSSENVAYASGPRGRRGSEPEGKRKKTSHRSPEMANTSRKLRNWNRAKRNGRPESTNSSQREFSNTYRSGFQTQRAKFFPARVIFNREQNHWTVEPNVGRVAHGIAKRVDRLKLLGNGQVCQVVEWIGRQIIEFDKTRLECGKIKS